MDKILKNNSHFIDCKICGKKITETPHEVWTNIPDHEIGWAVKDNERMESEAAEFWDKRVVEFLEIHDNC